MLKIEEGSGVKKMVCWMTTDMTVPSSLIELEKINIYLFPIINA